MFSELSAEESNYRRRFPRFCRPTIVGYCSLDGSRRLLHDASELKFIRKVEDCRVHYDLNSNLEQAVRADKDRDERIHHILKYMLSHERRLYPILRRDSFPLKDARFVCYRGLLTCLANTPYERRDSWRIVATLFKGIIFLCALDTDDKKKQKLNMSEKDMLFTSWGYKFEQYMLCDSPNGKPDASTALNENSEFSLVFTTNLGSHMLLYAAEMDGIFCRPDELPPEDTTQVDGVLKYLSDKKFIELKTNRHVEFRNQERNFRQFKMRKWWCQSFLAGVETIVCGFRDDDGIVSQLKVYTLKELPKIGHAFWNPDVCFNFVEDFLTYSKRCLAREISRVHGERRLQDASTVPTTSLHFSWSPGQNVRVTEYHPESDVILPGWFVDNFGKYSQL